MRELVEAHGGMDPFLEQNAVIVVADHAQSDVTDPLPLATGLGEHWNVLLPNDAVSSETQLAVGPSGRGAGVWILREGRRREALAGRVRRRIERDFEGVELISWIHGDGEELEAVVRNGSDELHFRAGGDVGDQRGGTWSVEGDLGALGASIEDGRFVAPGLPRRAPAALVGAPQSERRRHPA